MALALTLGANEAQAQEDHLQCYKVTNVNLKKLKGVVDIDAPGIGVTPGCKLGRAMHYCVPARSEVQPGPLFDGRIPLEPDPFETATTGDGRICCKVAARRP